MAKGEIKALLFADGIPVTPATPAPQSLRHLESDAINWDGTQTTVTYDVSASFTDARTGIWCLKDVANNYMQVLAEIDFPTATSVRITVGIPLASGTYYLVGV